MWRWNVICCCQPPAGHRFSGGGHSKGLFPSCLISEISETTKKNREASCQKTCVSVPRKRFFCWNVRFVLFSVKDRLKLTLSGYLYWRHVYWDCQAASSKNSNSKVSRYTQTFLDTLHCVYFRKLSYLRWAQRGRRSGRGDRRGEWPTAAGGSVWCFYSARSLKWANWENPWVVAEGTLQTLHGLQKDIGITVAKNAQWPPNKT